MEAIQPVFAVLAGAGVAMVGVRTIQLMMGSIHAHAFDAVAAKLLAAGNRDRALKLCAAANAGYAMLVSQVITKSNELSAREGEALVGGVLADTWNAAYKEQLSRVQRLGFLNPLGVLIAGTACFFPHGMADLSPLAQYAPVVVAFTLAVWNWKKVQRFSRECQRGSKRLLPLIVASVMRADS